MATKKNEKDKGEKTTSVVVHEALDNARRAQTPSETLEWLTAAKLALELQNDGADDL